MPPYSKRTSSSCTYAADGSYRCPAADAFGGAHAPTSASPPSEGFYTDVSPTDVYSAVTTSGTNKQTSAAAIQAASSASAQALDVVNKLPS